MGKEALILTEAYTLVDWSEDHDYSQDGPNIYRPEDHTIITDPFTSLPKDWKAFCWIWNDDTKEFSRAKDFNQSTLLNPTPCKDKEGNGEITIEPVTSNNLGFGNAMCLNSAGTWIDAKGDSAETMPCLAIALESGTGKKKLLKKGFIRNDAWNWVIGKWIYVSYSIAGGLTQDIAVTSQEQQIVGYATKSTIIKVDPSKTVENIK